jgi:hypothetical protein
LKTSAIATALLVSACSHASTKTPPVNQASGATDASVIRCTHSGNFAATGPTSPDVPLVMLYERSAWQSGFDLPSVLIYADGSIVYGDEPYGKSFRLYQAMLSPNEARELLRVTAAALRDAPASTEMSIATDQPEVQILFRDNDAWRVVEAYGMTRTTTEQAVPTSLRAVYATYRDLLQRRPSSRVPMPSGYPRPERWPEELPSFRGQHVVDAIALCAYRRGLEETGTR